MYFRDAKDVFHRKIIRHGIGILHSLSHKKGNCLSDDQWRYICKKNRGEAPYQSMRTVIDILYEYGVIERTQNGYLFEKYPEVIINQLESLIDDAGTITLSKNSLELAREFGRMWQKMKSREVARSAFNDRCLKFRKQQNLTTYELASAIHDLFLSGSLRSSRQSSRNHTRIPSAITVFHPEPFRQYFSLAVINTHTADALSQCSAPHQRIGFISPDKKQQRIPNLSRRSPVAQALTDSEVRHNERWEKFMQENL